MKLSVVDHDKGNAKVAGSRDKAETMKETAEEFGSTNVEIVEGEYRTYAEYQKRDEPEPEPIEEAPQADGGTHVVEKTGEQPVETGLEELGQNLSDDPLDILPGYMITTVDGKPSLNKRGVSVLAYHYGISVEDKETVLYPHECDFEAAVIEIEVSDEDGRIFTGVGEAHIDETPKHQLLRMAETRAYKRAVIFATGTGIVGYQELMEELE